MSDLRSFGRYLGVATLVGLITVGLREALGALFPQAPGQYAWSMLLAYGVGVVLSYLAQGRLTFGALGHRPSPQGLGGFAVVAVMSAALTALLAYVLRFGLPLEQRLPNLAAPLAFAAAALLVAPVSFLLGRHVVFGAAEPGFRFREAAWVWPTLALLVVVHSMVFGTVLLRVNGSGAYDDALFLRLAQDLAQGAWLGPYTATTLVKGPGFALWLAAVHVLHLPVALAASLTYACACVLLFVALRPLLPGSPKRMLIFMALLACPAALSDFSVMRELIYPALTLLVVASGVGLAARLEPSWQSAAPWCWAAGLGLTSAMFGLTREEWVWLGPLWFAVVARAAWVWIRGGVKFQMLCAVIGFVGLFAALPVLVVASLNRHHYGWFGVLEFNSRPFVSAYGALARVRHGEAPPQVPVPREVWARVASVSPTFAEVHVQLTGDIGSIWLGPSASLVGRLMDGDPAVRKWLSDMLQVPIPPGTSGGTAWLQERYRQDVAFRRAIESFLGGSRSAHAFFSGAMERESGGGWFVWMLREAVVATGHHHSVADANLFYQRLADEVNTACQSGALRCDAERHTLRPVLDWGYWRPFWSSLVYAGGHLLTMPAHTTAGTMKSVGESTALAKATAFLHGPLAASQATLAPVLPIEALIAVYRRGLPWLTGLAFLAWLWATPLPRRRLGPGQARLWLVGGLMLVLVGGRLALLALIHATSWPAAGDLRYLSAAQPLLVLFVMIGLMLGAGTWARRSALRRHPVQSAAAG